MASSSNNTSAPQRNRKTEAKEAVGDIIVNSLHTINETVITVKVIAEAVRREVEDF